ncbi:Formyltransferase/hydrolase complex Fhc subunit B [Symmachiella dynata]|uniref:formylmethanofuran dehydrogenase subunit B n=1 Tax=Symmachiella dynata TaxID=2527995 RepID=UPI00118960E2|nr:formylmethanofuran dehydrogenase subunit B [Symmachiella dynata]QDT48726.1 Formyltransferase/hydrolase complex Fhc subunit B [Symmachiella dynata]
MEVIQNVACTKCGCVCDDLQVSVENGRIQAVSGACELSESWFLEQDSQQPASAAINQKPVEIHTAIEHATDLLKKSQAPLIFGLSRSSSEGQRAAVQLADTVGAIIDTTASLCHAPSIMAIQHVGESTSSLGEIKNRADLVIFWGVDPVISHPRHFERYSVDPVGEFVPNGRSDRTVIVIDSERTQTADAADIFLQVEPGTDFEMIWALRSLLRGERPAEDAYSGIPIDQLTELADRMKSCRCGVVFFGLGLAHQQLGHLNVEALLRLVTDLNAHTRFHARRMRMHGDVTGADCVLCWQTGYPFGVNLGRGYPRYNPGEYSANDLLERGEVDLCLLVGGESVPHMSPAARRYLETIPTILLDYPTLPVHFQPQVQFTTAVYGVHLPGVVYRMDEVPIPLRQVLPASYPSDAEILQRITDTFVNVGG